MLIYNARREDAKFFKERACRTRKIEEKRLDLAVQPSIGRLGGMMKTKVSGS
jgi:hypothetical protein